MVPGSTLSSWKKQLEKILEMPKRARASISDPTCAYPEMEEKLFSKFWERRQEGKIVRRGWFRLASKWLFGQVYPGINHTQFKFSNGWFLGFLSRWGISIRITTNKAQKIPEDYKSLIINWFQFNRRNSQLREASYELGLPIPDTLCDIGWYYLRNICNMDQTPLPFEYLSGRTYALKGDKTIWVKATKSGWDKRQATIMLTVFADGVPRVPPVIIFRGSDNLEEQERYYGEERKRYDNRVVVWFNEKGYANESIMLKWFVTYLIPALNNDERQVVEGPATPDGTSPLLEGPPNPSIIVLDAAKFHRTDAVLECLRSWDIKASLIPGGCTGLIQPLDVSINGPFKNILCDVLDTEIDKLGEETLNNFDIETESAIGQRRVLMTKAVGKAWSQVLWHLTLIYIFTN